MMIPTETWLNYKDLDVVLQQLGYVRGEYADARIYKHPREERAILSFPPLPWSDPVRTYHLVSTRLIVSGFNIADKDNFELLLVRAAHQTPELVLTA